MRTFPASFPHTIWLFWLFFCFLSQGFCQFWEQSVDENLPCILSPYYLIFSDFFLFFFSGFLPVLKTICRWEPSPHPFPILFDIFLIIFCFFLRVFASFENILQMRTFPASFPHTIWYFSDYFLFLSQGFCQFWEHSANENLPCILSPYYLLRFCFFFVFFFSWFLPVLKTICRWEPSVHPFPILFDFFLIIFCFFLRVFDRFENNLQMNNFPASFPHTICFFFWLFFVFFSGFCQFWEQSVDENLPCILSPYYLIFFLIIFCFFFMVFDRFENNLQMNNFPASFPHTICFFSDYFLFFSQGFASFENNL